MHGERDLLNRFVFPELARRGRNLCLEILPIDLRWGVPQFGSDAGNDHLLATVRQVRACVDEIDRCHFFVGLLGDRYGWKLNLAGLANSKSVEARSLAQKIGHVYRPGMSITELEMSYAALGSDPSAKRDRAFFFLRDSSPLVSIL
jgi:telomerase protein component 1